MPIESGSTLSGLPDGQATNPAANDISYLVTDPAGSALSQYVTLNKLLSRAGISSLSSGSLVSATSLTVYGLPFNMPSTAGWVVIDPFTTECEIRRVTSRSGNTVSFASGLAYTHAANDSIFFIDDGVVNPRWMAATGDGSTDDTTSMQRAIDQLSDGMELIIPAGNFKITTKLTLSGKENVKITGLGGTILNIGCTGLEIKDTGGADCQHNTIKGVYIVSNDHTQTGIDIVQTGAGVRRNWIGECLIFGQLIGIRVQTSQGNFIYKNNLQATDKAGSIGILIESSDNKIEGNVIRGFDEGIALDGGSQLVLGNHIFTAPSVSCHADITIRRGYTVQTSGFVVANNYLDGFPSDGFLIINAQSARQVIVESNYFRIVDAAAGPPILFENGGSTFDAQQVSITGNIFVNVTGSPVTDTITFTGIQTDDSTDLHIFANVFGSQVTPFSTRDERQTATSATNYTPDPMKGRTLELTVTGSLTVLAPAGSMDGGIGNRMTFIILQDGTGGRVVGWGAVYLKSWSDTGNTAGKRSSITFEWDGTNWVQIGAQSPYV